MTPERKLLREARDMLVNGSYECRECLSLQIMALLAQPPAEGQEPAGLQKLIERLRIPYELSPRPEDDWRWLISDRKEAADALERLNALYAFATEPDKHAAPARPVEAQAGEPGKLDAREHELRFVVAELKRVRGIPKSEAADALDNLCAWAANRLNAVFAAPATPEVQADARDAARWRWLRKGPAIYDGPVDDDLEDAIDATLAAQRSPE